MPLKTITVPLALIGPAVKTALINRCNTAIAAVATGATADAYFQKVIDRLNDATATGKITIPVAILDATLINAMKARANQTTPDWKAQFKQRIIDNQLDDGTPTP